MPTQGTTTNATVALGWVTSSGVSDGGSVFHAGNVASDSPVSNPVTIIATVDDLRDIGSTVVAKDGTLGSTTDSAGITEPLSAGTLGYTSTATQWVMRGGRVTTTLSNVAFAGFNTPGADYNGVVRDNIHELTTTRRLGTGATFDFLAPPSTEITPNFTKGAGAGDVQYYVAPTGAGDVPTEDQASTPTRAVPGELTYRDGSAEPFTDEYKAKDSGE